MPHREYSIAEGVRVTEICDPRFRTCLAELNFYFPHTPENTAAAAVLPDLLTGSSAEYPSWTALTRALSRLYDCDLSASLRNAGDSTELSISACWLDDAFVPKTEHLTERAAALLCGCLAEPEVNEAGTAFAEDAFAFAQQKLLRDIDSVKDDRRNYALLQAEALAFAGQPAALPSFGTRAGAEKLTSEQALAQWREILRTAPCEIVCVLPEEKPALRQALTALFAPYSREPLMPKRQSPAPQREVPLTETERMDIQQSKLVLVFSCTGIPADTAKLLCTLLGSSPNSMLFRNVREAEGLCYYCDSFLMQSKEVLIIETGAEDGDLPHIREGILQQIAALQADSFPEEMLDQARKYSAYSSAWSADLPEAIVEHIIGERLRGTCRSAEEREACVQRITRTEIVQAAQKLSLLAEFALRKA